MDIWDEIISWLRKTPPLSDKAKQTIIQNPDKFQGLYQLYTPKPGWGVRPQGYQPQQTANQTDKVIRSVKGNDGQIHSFTESGKELTFPDWKSAEAYSTPKGNFLTNPPTWFTNPYAQGKPLAGMAVHPETTSDIGAVASLAFMGAMGTPAQAVAPLANILGTIPKVGKTAVTALNLAGVDTSMGIVPDYISQGISALGKIGKGKAAIKWAEEQFAKGTTIEDITRGLSHLKIPEADAAKIIERLTSKVIPTTEKVVTEIPKVAEQIAPKTPEVAPKVGETVSPANPKFTELNQKLNELFAKPPVEAPVPPPVEAQAGLKAGEVVPPIKPPPPTTIAPPPPTQPPLPLPKEVPPKTTFFGKLKTIGKEILAIEGKPPGVAAEMPPEIKTAVDELTSYIEGAPKLAREEKELIKHQWRSKQAGKLAGIQAGTTSEQGALAKSLSVLKGEIPNPAFAPPETILKDTFTKLDNYILQSDLQPFTKTNTQLALEKVFRGEIPTEGDFNLLENLFGEKLIKELRARSHWTKKVWSSFIDLSGLPRALLASFDESGILRQAVLQTLAHPKAAIRNVRAAFKASAYSKWAFEIDAAMRSDPMWWLVEQTQTYMAPLGRGVANIAKYEESFMSRIALHIPGIRQSERGYITYLNKMRFDTLKSLYNDAVKMGMTDADLKNLNLVDWGKLVNISSGRGLLPGEARHPAATSAYASFLNNLFFSPRLVMSRLETPVIFADFVKKSLSKVSPLTKGGYERSPQYIARLTQQRDAARVALKESAKQIAAFVSFGLTVLGTLKMTMGDKVQIELDPRSSDVGKVKIGNTRIDPWGGFQQYLRLAVQMITGQRKTTTTGGVVPINRLDVLENFATSKTAPVFTLMLDILRGKDYRGQPVDFTSLEGVKPQAFNRLVPIGIQDFMDAFNDAGIGVALGSGTGTFFGMGASTYPDTLVDKEALIGTYVKTKEGKDDLYTVTDFGGDIGRLGYTEGNYGSPLVQFYFKSKKEMESYYNTLESKRYSYRETHPEVDAMLFFWGRVTTLQSGTAKTKVLQYLEDFGLTEDDLRTPLTKTTTSTAAPPTFGTAPKRKLPTLK